MCRIRHPRPILHGGIARLDNAAGYAGEDRILPVILWVLCDEKLEPFTTEGTEIAEERSRIFSKRSATLTLAPLPPDNSRRAGFFRSAFPSVRPAAAFVPQGISLCRAWRRRIYLGC